MTTLTTTRVPAANPGWFREKVMRDAAADVAMVAAMFSRPGEPHALARGRLIELEKLVAEVEDRELLYGGPPL